MSTYEENTELTWIPKEGSLWRKSNGEEIRVVKVTVQWHPASRGEAESYHAVLDRFRAGDPYSFTPVKAPPEIGVEYRDQDGDRAVLFEIDEDGRGYGKYYQPISGKWYGSDYTPHEISQFTKVEGAQPK